MPAAFEYINRDEAAAAAAAAVPTPFECFRFVTGAAATAAADTAATHVSAAATATSVAFTHAAVSEFFTLPLERSATL